jgi:hypothetical protein
MDLGWHREAFDEAFRVIESSGRARADWDVLLVWVPNSVRYDPPQAKNVLIGWIKNWDQWPECDLLDEAAQGLMETITQFQPDYRACFPEAFGKPLAKPFGKPFGMAYRIPPPPPPPPQPPPPPPKEEELARSVPEAVPPEPPVLVFPTSGKVKSWSLVGSQIDRWEELYPGVAIRSECRKALGWIEANPTKRKTARGMPKFLNGWLSRTQDAGGNGRASPPAPKLGFHAELLALSRPQIENALAESARPADFEYLDDERRLGPVEDDT